MVHVDCHSQHIRICFGTSYVAIACSVVLCGGGSALDVISPHFGYSEVMPLMNLWHYFHACGSCKKNMSQTHISCASTHISRFGLTYKWGTICIARVPFAWSSELLLGLGRGVYWYSNYLQVQPPVLLPVQLFLVLLLLKIVLLLRLHPQSLLIACGKEIRFVMLMSCARVLIVCSHVVGNCVTLQRLR